jgi:hypothetical protein
LRVNALDAAGQFIVGPGAYVDAAGNPVSITISDSDTSGATSISPTSVADPSTTTVTLQYNGAQIPSFTVTASAPGLTSSAVTFTVNSSPQLVYTALFGCGTFGSPERSNMYIERYQTPSSGTTTIGALVGTVTFPKAASFAVSRSHDMFVADATVVSHYAPDVSDPTSPSATFTSAAFIHAIAVDSANGIWIAGMDRTSNVPDLLHYAPGASGTPTPDRTITGIAGLPPSLAFDARTVAVDSRDNVYTVAEQAGASTQAHVYELPPSANGSAVMAIGSYPLDKTKNTPGMVSIDQHTDTVWTYPANVYAGGSVVPPPGGATPIGDNALVAYPNGSATPSRVIYDLDNEIYFRSLAADDAGNVYALNTTTAVQPAPCNGNGVVYVYAPSQNGFVKDPPRFPGSVEVVVPALTVPAPPAGASGSRNSSISASPSSLTFLASGSQYSTTVAASEPGYSGAFSATSANTAIATVAPGSSPNSFVVTPVNAGTTTLTVRDASGGYTTVPVSVSITGLQLQRRR